MRNFKQPGAALDCVAPAGGVVSGVALLIASILIVPAVTAAAGQPYTGYIEGVYELPCATGTAWAQFDVLYWDAAAKRLTTTVGSNTKVGFAAAPKEAGLATGLIKLLPQV